MYVTSASSTAGMDRTALFPAMERGMETSLRNQTFPSVSGKGAGPDSGHMHLVPTVFRRGLHIPLACIPRIVAQGFLIAFPVHEALPPWPPLVSATVRQDSVTSGCPHCIPACPRLDVRSSPGTVHKADRHPLFVDKRICRNNRPRPKSPVTFQESTPPMNLLRCLPARQACSSALR